MKTADQNSDWNSITFDYFFRPKNLIAFQRGYRTGKSQRGFCIFSFLNSLKSSKWIKYFPYVNSKFTFWFFFTASNLGVKGSFDIQSHLKITLREYWVSEMILIYSGNYCFGIDFLSVSETFRNNEESVKCRFSFSVWEGQKNYRKPMFSCYIQWGCKELCLVSTE